MKLCLNCEEVKAKSEFYACAANTDGQHSRCKECWKLTYNKDRTSAYNKASNDKKYLKKLNYKPRKIDIISSELHSLKCKVIRQNKIDKWNQIFKRLKWMK